MFAEVDTPNLTRLRTSGTSIGALVGGLYVREGDLITSSARAKQFSGRMGNIWRLLSDVTYPIVAYTMVSSPEVKTHSVYQLRGYAPRLRQSRGIIRSIWKLLTIYDSCSW